MQEHIKDSNSEMHLKPLDLVVPGFLSSRRERAREQVRAHETPTKPLKADLFEGAQIGSRLDRGRS